jgi:murein DD-endopeptidase
MEYYSIPQEPEKINKKPLYRKKFIISLMVISLGLNFYFFAEKTEQYFAGDNTELAQVDTSPPVKKIVEDVVSEQPPVTAKIKKAAFVAPEKIGDEKVKILNFKIKNSINHTLCQSLPKEECGLMTAYMGRILAWHFDLNKYLRKDDTGYLIYKNVPGEEDHLKILKLNYHSQYLGKTLEINYFKNPEAKFGAYFDRAGTEMASRISKAQAPIREYNEITSLPGDFRKKTRSGHSGTDFKVPVGAPIYSSFDGKVKRVNWNRRMNGYCVEVDHPQEKIKTLYLHLSKTSVKSGMQVKQGQKIGESGNTGRSFAPHLHYEIQGRGKVKKIYNPFVIKNFKIYNDKIPAKLMPAFKKTLASYNALIQQG